MGQIAAALAAGNAVIAKPAEQTPLIAAAAIQLLHEAGIPARRAASPAGRRRRSARRWSTMPRIAGVAFTGSTETARAINLRARHAAGSDRAADRRDRRPERADRRFHRRSPEQVVGDILASAFNSAGQRCSALRVLFVQERHRRPRPRMLEGAMRELVIGDPALLATDVGPVIDAAAPRHAERACGRMTREARLLYRCALPPGTENGTFFAPAPVEIASPRSARARGLRAGPARRPLAQRRARRSARRRSPRAATA